MTKWLSVFALLFLGTGCPVPSGSGDFYRFGELQGQEEECEPVALPEDCSGDQWQGHEGEGHDGNGNGPGPGHSDHDDDGDADDDHQGNGHQDQDGCDDLDGDGVADEDDVCPGYDDTVDCDDDGIPAGCDGEHTITVVVAVPTSGPVGQTFTFTATVTREAGGPPPTGMVAFTDITSGALLGTATLDAAGQAVLSINALGAGTRTVEAAYLGVAGLLLPSSDTVTVTVTGPGVTSTEVTTSDSVTVFGEPVTFTVTVTGSGPTPTGTVTFFDTTNATTLGSATLDASAVADLTLTSLSVGSHTITAIYSGDGAHGGSADSTTQTVNQASTTTFVSASPSAISPGQNVTFTADVSQDAPSIVAPAGLVTFVDTTAGVTLGTATISGSGSATLQVNVLTASGTHTIAATYNGSASHASSSDTVDVPVGP